MPDDTTTWSLIHAERRGVAETLDGLSPEQWDAQSLCGGWTVRVLAAHILAGAEQTTGHFLSGIAASGFRFNTFMQRDAHRLSQLAPAQIIERLRQRTTTTNHPPAPVMAMLGEVVVHGEDIRAPLGLPGKVADDAANACLEMYTKASFPVGGKKRIGGLRLVSTDTGWSWGAGPEVSGPALSLLLAMTGRPAGLDKLTGDGAAEFGRRVTARAS
jgi:uncharacterized protein (TIGR03083 family)